MGRGCFGCGLCRLGMRRHFRRLFLKGRRLGRRLGYYCYMSQWFFGGGVGVSTSILATKVHSIHNRREWRYLRQRLPHNWILGWMLRLLRGFHIRSQDCKLEFVSYCVRTLEGRMYSKLLVQHREVGDRMGHQKFEPGLSHQNMREQ
jgi:hypothetical protein